MPNSTIATDILGAKTERADARRAIQVIILSGLSVLIVDTRQFPLMFAEGDIQGFNAQFIAVLNDLRRDVQERGYDLREYQHNYLERLSDIGRAAYNLVLPQNARDYIADLAIQEGERGLGFTFKMPPTYPLFWEMLYAGQNFQVECEQFWGFRYPLGRTFWEYEAPDRVRLRAGAFSAIHEKLNASREEIRRLAQYLTETGLRLGRSLTLQLLDQAIPLEDLCLKRILELFHDDEFRYGLVHFACHCEQPEGLSATEAYLSFTAHGQQVEISLKQLLSWQNQKFIHCPFVFLNACESATPHRLLQTLSFPIGLLGFGAAGVIATACIIPDNFASAFANEFYRQLLNMPGGGAFVNIGEALLKTRLHFLNNLNNPLGLAYGLYAVSNQQLRLLD